MPSTRLNQYFVVEFRFPGKQAATAFSTDMVVPRGKTHTELQQLGEAALQKMFADIFPEAALPHLIQPERVLVIPGALFFVPDGGSE